MAKLTVIDDFTVGDSLPILKCNWGEGDVDITGWTIVANIRKPDASLLTKTATITDGGEGDFEFQFATSDLVAGWQPMQIVFTDTSADVFTIGHMVLSVQGTV
jgi:hypothetical protein